MRNSSWPASRARCTMLTSRGPLNISGKRVSTSIFICSLPRRRDSSCRSLLFVLDDLEGATQALLGAAGQQQRTDGIDRHTLSSDNTAHVAFVQPQFVNRHPIALHRRNRHVIRILHQPFDHEFQERFHDPPPFWAVMLLARASPPPCPLS